MPRYFFHMRIGEELIVEDEEGGEYPDLMAAHQEALSSAADLIRNKIQRRRPINAARIEIVDEKGEMILAVPLKTLLN